MNWTWAGIITAACILIAAVIGYNRGFIKEAVSTLLLFLSILMVWFINPYVNQFLRENTPLYTTLSEGSAKAVSGVIESGVKVSREEQGKLIDSLSAAEDAEGGYEGEEYGRHLSGSGSEKLFGLYREVPGWSSFLMESPSLLPFFWPPSY